MILSLPRFTFSYFYTSLYIGIFHLSFFGYFDNTCDRPLEIARQTFTSRKPYGTRISSERVDAQQRTFDGQFNPLSCPGGVEGCSCADVMQVDVDQVGEDKWIVQGGVD